MNEAILYEQADNIVTLMSNHPALRNPITDADMVEPLVAAPNACRVIRRQKPYG